MIDSRTRTQFLDLLANIANRKDRAKCAQLRRSLSYEPGEYGDVLPYLGEIANSLPERERRAVYLVGGWYGLWRGKISSDDWAFGRYGLPFGRAMRFALSRESGAVKDAEERRIARFLNLDSAGMETLVPQMIARIAAARGATIDWGELLDDVANWGEGTSWSPPEAGPGWMHPSRKWARDFWSGPVIEIHTNKNASPQVLTHSLEEQKANVA